MESQRTSIVLHEPRRAASIVLAEGWVWKRAVTSPLPIWSRRWVRICSDGITIHRPTRHASDEAEREHEVRPSRVLRFDASSGLQFQSTRRISVAHGGMVLLLQADRVTVAREWASALQRALIARAQEEGIAERPLALIARAQEASAESPLGIGSSSRGTSEGGGTGIGSGGLSRLSGMLPAAWRLASASVRRVAERVSDRLRSAETCELCCEKVAHRSFHSNAGCGHRCCESCWQRYLAVDLPATCARMRHARAYTLRCPWAPGCSCPLDRGLLGKFGPQPLKDIAAAIGCREQLIERAAAIGCRWLECPQAGCVGVGYDDSVQETAMCFACQHQFEVPPRGVMRVVGSAIYSWLLSWWPERIDGVSGWRPCPHCGAAILKDGGCDNMRCGMCQRTFRWGMRRNSIDGVVEAHAPPARAQARAASWTM